MKSKKLLVLHFIIAFLLSLFIMTPDVSFAEEIYVEHPIKPFSGEKMNYYSSSFIQDLFITYGFPSSWKTGKVNSHAVIYPDAKDKTEYVQISVLPIAQYDNPNSAYNIQNAVQHLTKDAPAVEGYSISNPSAEYYSIEDVCFAKIMFDRSETIDGKTTVLHHNYYVLPVHDYATLFVDVILTEGTHQKYTEKEEAILLTAACNNQYVFKDYLVKTPDAKMPQFQLPVSSPEPTPTPSSPIEKSAASVSYVLNTNSKKFHKPTCSSVDSMSSKNRVDSNLSRDEIINMGYVPCKRCNP